MNSALKVGMRFFLSAILAGSAAVPVAAAHEAQSTSAQVSLGGPPGFRRLNEDQYKRSIAQIFGADIKIPGRFEPPVREDGLLAIGDSKVIVTPAGLEQYAIRASEISAQVLDDRHRKTFLLCEPSSTAAFSESCARQFLGKYGRSLFRRPLTNKEMTSALNETRLATEKSGSAYRGLQAGLSALLISPSFIFRMETAEPDPDRGGAWRLDTYSLATRISFLLWDAPPDDELLNAADSGALRKKDGLLRQADRMMASPKFEQGVRAFFSDMLAYDQFDGLYKDPSLFPIFNPQLRNDAKEQSLRTIVDHLLSEQKDYRELFTTKKAFLSRSLGALFGVRVDYRAFDGWMPYTFPPDDPHAGILTLPAFLMLDPAHEGKTSPTIRGKKLRELFLCQRVPDPPGNVDFGQFEDPKNPNPTVRERLAAHRANPVCSSCHSMMDPVGLSMEHFDAVGQYRSTEKGVTIDASGEFEKKPYPDLAGLEKVLTESPALTKCVVQRVYEYGAGRQIRSSEREAVASIHERFAKSGYKLPALMREIATASAFQAVSPESVTSN